jgi:hypothetical protein
MNFSQWKENSKLFLIENENRYSYGQLFEAISKLSQDISRLSDQKNYYVLEAEHSFHSYVRYLTLLLSGQSVLLCSSEQFLDQSYLELLSKEANEKFITWALKENEPSFEIDNKVESNR